ELPANRVLLNGEDVTREVRPSAVTEASGPVADSRVVREHLVALQRSVAFGRDMVCEGRDQGTIVFPDAACKFFLLAEPAERARRRQKEMTEGGEAHTWEQVLQSQAARDRRAHARDLAPMVPAPDAIILDNTRMKLEEVVDFMEAKARERLAMQGSTDT